MTLSIQPAELDSRTISPSHLNAALSALREDGYVVLENVVPHPVLDVLRARMDEDSEKLIRAKKWGGAGQLPGHLQQGPPPFSPYIFPEIVANLFVIQVTRALLGSGLFNSFYNGNTNCPGSTTQPLHRDGGHLWPGIKLAHPTASVVVNISPMDVSEANGAVELWPGSHLDTSTDRRIEAADEERRRRIAPPVRGVAAKGSALIRDVRLWHRGVPNPSDRPRHMIAMIHNAGWLQPGRRLKYNRGCEAAFPEGDLDHNAEFTDEVLDYLFKFP